MFQRLKFSKLWTASPDTPSFPAVETNEAQVRADMQYLFDEIRDFLNNTLLPAVEAGGAANIGVTDLKGEVTTVQKMLQALEELKHKHENMSLLSTYTQTETDLKDAVNSKHGHSNKGTLDSIDGVSQVLGKSVTIIPSEAAVNAALAGISLGQLPVGSVYSALLKTSEEGTTGQLLTRDENAEGGFNWQDAPEIGLILKNGRLYQDGADVTNSVLVSLGAYQISNQDLVAGESPLADGTLYFVYE